MYILGGVDISGVFTMGCFTVTWHHHGRPMADLWWIGGKGQP